MARKKTLSEQLNAMAAPKVKDYDIEDDEQRFQSESEDEKSDYSEVEEESTRDHYVQTDRSKLRNNTATINLGSKYVGSKTSRDEVFDSDQKDDEEDDEESESENDQQEVQKDTEFEEFDIEGEEGSDILADVTDSDEEDENDEDDSEDDLEEDLTDEKFKRSQLSKLLNQEKKTIVTRLSSTAKADALKGYSVLQQHKLFDKILDPRIKIQKAMTAANQLPLDAKSFKDFKTKKSADSIKETKELLSMLLTSIINLRAKLYNEELVTKTEVKVNLKKRSLDNFLQETSKLDDILKLYKTSVLSKWSNKVQLANGSASLNSDKFKTINQNIDVQVENNLQDMDRLIKRTRLNRRNVVPLGYVAPKETEVSDDDDEDNATVQSQMDASLQAQSHIFDDDDFYRVLLNDMVDKKIADKQSMSSAAIITLTKNKIHKNYERKATKGRKLIYTIQDPLAHFEAPKARSYSWNDDQIDELFASLLGQKVSMNENSESESESESDAEDSNTVKVSNAGVSLFS